MGVLANKKINKHIYNEILLYESLIMLFDKNNHLSTLIFLFSFTY